MQAEPPTIALVKAAITVPAKADIIAPVEVRPPKCKTCKERRRIANAAHRKASASSKLPVVQGEADGAVAVEEVEVAGAADNS